MNHENAKHQLPNFKWFDTLTTQSQVEGQILMTQIQKKDRYD
jgi:hypothetical protein